VANGTRDWFQGRDKAPILDDKPEVEQESPPPMGKWQAWGLANKLQMGVSLFSVKGKSRSPAYINYVDAAQDGAEVIIFFHHMKVKIIGKGLEALVEGLRRQVVYYIQAQHVSDFEAKQEAHWVESIKISPAAEPEELGKWAG
jgi:hypothetical protein